MNDTATHDPHCWESRDMSGDGWNDVAWAEAAEEYRAQREHSGGSGRNDSEEIAQLEIVRLAGLSLAAYEFERKATAKQLRMRTAAVDKLVEAERKKKRTGR